jgi:hypothetical protein
MKALNVIGVIMAVTAIALGGIAVVVAAAVSLLLVQSVSATTDVLSTTTSVGGQQEAVSITTTTTTPNNISDALLGNLFFIGESETISFNQINATYFAISEVGNVTIMPPPNATAATTINATETINITVDIQPNGVGFDQGQILLVTEADDDGAAGGEEENATISVVDISRTNRDGTGNATGVAFFSTNSTGQLAFLDNMIAIYQLEISPEGSTTRMWEWKGADRPFESVGDGAAAPTTGNQTLSP